jgi:hypothetical protein
MHHPHTSGDCGKSHKPAYVLLVATHADLARPGRKTSSGGDTEELRRKVEERFGAVFSIEERVAVVDSHAASSPGIKVGQYGATFHGKATSGREVLTSNLAPKISWKPKLRVSVSP